MYPLLLDPVLKSDLWGGTALMEKYGFASDTPTVSQAIVLSGKENSGLAVKNGRFAGQALSEVLASHADKKRVPIDIKLLHTFDRTSIKVSLCTEGPLFNSDTLLYIAECDRGAEIIYGLYRDTSITEFERIVGSNQISKICNYVSVKRGDLFVIPSGTVYAVGKGIIALQISPSCAKDYRIYDYGRLDADKKPRNLQFKAAANSICTTRTSLPFGQIGEVTLYPFGTVRELFSCEKFGCELLNIDGAFGAYEKDGLISLVVLNGAATISYPSGNVHISKGDSLIIPRDTRIKVTGKAEILYTHF